MVFTLFCRRYRGFVIKRSPYGWRATRPAREQRGGVDFVRNSIIELHDQIDLILAGEALAADEGGAS
jgi:hypothetical protein